MKKKMKTTRTTIRLEKNDLKMGRMIADELDISFSKYIRNLLKRDASQYDLTKEFYGTEEGYIEKRFKEVK